MHRWTESFYALNTNMKNENIKSYTSDDTLIPEIQGNRQTKAVWKPAT